MTYAYECALCGHLTSQHRARPDGDLVDGPYDCRQCGCEMSQTSPVFALSKWQFESRHAAAVLGGTE